MPSPTLTRELVLELLTYDPEAGDFFWKPRAGVKQSWNTRYAGKIAGSDWTPDGNAFYRVIRIFDWPFFAHRLAVLIMTGEMPENDTDHKDLNGLNNCWENLRPATKGQNSANRLPGITNTTGYRGVSPHQGKFRATFRGKFLGYRDTPVEAAALYDAASLAHFGEFARPQ